jgi:hypothetical protein
MAAGDPVGPIAPDPERLVGTEAVRRTIRIAKNRRLYKEEVTWAMIRLDLIDICVEFAYAELERANARIEELERELHAEFGGTQPFEPVTHEDGPSYLDWKYSEERM